MDNNSTKLIAAFGSGTSLVLSGVYFCSSQLAIPPLYALPAKLSTVAFVDIFYRGAATVVPPTVVSTAALATAAYLVPEKRREFGGAALFTLAVLPWTQGVMMGTISRLIDLSKGGAALEKVGEKGVNELLASWKWMNFARFGTTFVGGALSLYTLVK